MMKSRWNFMALILITAMISMTLAGTSEAQIRNRLRFFGQNRTTNQTGLNGQAFGTSGGLGAFDFDNRKEWVEFLRDLDLSNEQKSALKALREESAPGLKSSIEKVAEIRQQLHEATQADELNENTIRDLSTQFAQAVGDLAIQQGVFHQKLKTILTPEQMAKWKETQDKRQQQRQQRMQAGKELSEN